MGRDDDRRAAPAARLASRSITSAPVFVSRLPGRLVGEDHARLDRRARARSRPAAARRPRARPAGASRAVGEPDLGRAAPASARAARRPARRWARAPTSTFCSAVSVGIRLNCWKTNPNARSRSSASSLSRQPREVAALEEHLAARSAGRARRGAGAASSCPSRSAPRARRTRRRRSQVDAVEARTVTEPFAKNSRSTSCVPRRAARVITRPPAARRRGAAARRGTLRRRRRSGRRRARAGSRAARIAERDRRGRARSGR